MSQIKTLNANSIYTHYNINTTGGWINMFFNRNSIREFNNEQGNWYNVRPIAIVLDDTDKKIELEIDNITFNIKKFWKEMIDKSSETDYYVIRIYNDPKEYQTEDGLEHSYHNTRVLAIKNPKLISDLQELESKQWRIDEFDEEDIL